MPLAEPFLTGAPCWADLSTTDPDRAIAFYSSVFGWRAERGLAEFGGYINFFNGESRVCGCVGAAQNDAPVAWQIYLRTADAAATLSKVEGAGGQVVMPMLEVGTLGKMAFMLDPGQAAIGLWEPGDHLGFTRKGEPGAVGWFELHTRAYDTTLNFYRTVFDWETHAVSDTPEFRYTTLGTGETQAAGVMDNSMWVPEGTPAEWSLYFEVTNTDEAIERAIAAGATVTTAAEDTPYGRLAQLVDPMGARFKLMAH